VKGHSSDCLTLPFSQARYPEGTPVPLARDTERMAGPAGDVPLLEGIEEKGCYGRRVRSCGWCGRSRSTGTRVGSGLRPNTTAAAVTNASRNLPRAASRRMRLSFREADGASGRGRSKTAPTTGICVLSPSIQLSSPTNLYAPQLRMDYYRLNFFRTMGDSRQDLVPLGLQRHQFFSWPPRLGAAEGWKCISGGRCETGRCSFDG
jgi:hypothetical protein